MKYLTREPGKKIAESFGIPLLGQIPLDPKVSREADSGVPFIIDFNSAASKAFGEIVSKIEKALN